MAELISSIAELQTVTPMMQQYLDVKAEYADYVLMYRLGDFYEMFFEDAVRVSAALELTLTGRDCGDGKRAAMCGVPFHKADLYIGKLVEKGFKVAVCEQTEDPALAKGLVKRQVIRVVTPGTVTDGSLLPDQSNNYLAAVCLTDEETGLGFADISTGEVRVTVLTGPDRGERLLREIGAYMPREAILSVPAVTQRDLADLLTNRCGAMLTDDLPMLFDVNEADRLLRDIPGADQLQTPAARMAAGALLGYIHKTQMCDASFVKGIEVYTDGEYLEIDAATRRNLELTESMRTKEKRGSLLWVLDQTRTSMGARLIRSWLLRPLLNPVAIGKRQSAVRELSEQFMLREELRNYLGNILDLERLTARAVYGTANARDLAAIGRSIADLPAIASLLADARSAGLRETVEDFDVLSDLSGLLSSALNDDPPFSVRDGGMIRAGYNTEVDKLRAIGESGDGWMRDIEAREKEATGIRTLKVGYNKVFGYYIEVSKSFAESVPAHYIRKQTLTNCERFITQELKEMETTVLGASEKLCALEYELFCSVRDTVASVAGRIQQTADKLATLDVYAALADTATKHRYVCPEVDSGDRIEIRDGRHPVVERFVTDSYFVPNDTDLSTGKNRLMLITGPNMAGKSTYMRQVAIITLLAQIGSFVPASSAHIGVVDKLFTRVGASDDLASGQSTFMLEMTEVANILRNATRRSLIIYDEVGRGTSTYDGMSIARAVVEYTAGKKLGAKTLFATHYHELTALEGQYEGVINYHIAAKKRGDTITFLRKIVKGATDDSYGIEVAKLAGVPNEVVKRAREVLAQIENGEERPKTGSSARPQSVQEPDMLQVLARSEAEDVAEKIRQIDLNTLTPIEALNFVYSLKKMLTVGQ